jgi:hypothetical protein
MNLSDNTHPTRRRFLVSGISLLVCGAGASLLSGCGDDKGTMKQVENAPDMKTKAQDSMKFYLDKKSQAKGKH